MKLQLENLKLNFRGGEIFHPDICLRLAVCGLVRVCSFPTRQELHRVRTTMRIIQDISLIITNCDFGTRLRASAAIRTK